MWQVTNVSPLFAGYFNKVRYTSLIMNGHMHKKTLLAKAWGKNTLESGSWVGRGG